MQVFGGDGASIDVRIVGAERAEPVVLIHGFPLARAIWDAQIDALARTHRVILPDLRGMGASGVPAGPYLMESLAADVAAALDALALERAAIVGHSLGGYVALAFARMFSERLSRLALVTSRLSADAPDRAAARNELADRTERSASIAPVLDAYLGRMLAPQTLATRPDIVARLHAIAARTQPRGAAAMLRGMALRDPCDDIAGEIEVPVLVVAGGCDRLCAVQEAGAVAQAFPAGQLVVCAASGHVPMLEEPDRLTAALVAFLNG